MDIEICKNCKYKFSLYHTTRYDEYQFLITICDHCKSAKIYKTLDEIYKLNLKELENILIVDKDCPYYMEHQLNDYNQQ